MIACTCCDRLIRGKPGYSARLGVYEQLSPRCVLRVGWTRRALCPTCTRRIEQGYARRAAARRRPVFAGVVA